MEDFVQEKLTFDVWCLINPNYRQIVRRVIGNNRRDLARGQLVEDINTHINANKPILLAHGKKLRYWESLTQTKPPWANELYLYQEGHGPESEHTDLCQEHGLHFSGGGECPICAGTHN